MENRTNIIADYFKLRVLLNKTNKYKNERTQIEFQIIAIPLGFALVAMLQGSSNNIKFELCTWRRFFGWKEGGHFGINSLENYFRDILKAETRHFQKNENHIPYSDQMLLLKDIINKNIQSLGIPEET